MLSAVLSLSITGVYTHPGRLDKNGGHYKTSDGSYHYHSGSDRSVEYSSKPSSQTSSKSSSSTSSTSSYVPPAYSINGRMIIPVDELKCLGSFWYDSLSNTVYLD